MNKRKGSSKAPIELDKICVTNKGWNVEEKTILLAGLKRYGHTDIHNISRMLPKKTESAVRMMIHKTMQKAETLSKVEDSALNDWLESKFFKDDTVPVPEALKYIALFEDHPSPQESGGFDFSAAYDYLYRLSLGYPAIVLPDGTLAKLNQLMDEVREEVWNSPAGESEVVRYLAALKRTRHKMKSYPPRNG